MLTRVNRQVPMKLEPTKEGEVMVRSYVLSLWGVPFLIGFWSISAPVRAQNCFVPVQSQPQVSCAPQVAYMPQVSYRTVWRQVPVTTYRPVTYTDLLGLQTTYLQPVTAMQWQAQQEAYTTYVQSTSNVPVMQGQAQQQGYPTYRPVFSNNLTSPDAFQMPQSLTATQQPVYQSQPAKVGVGSGIGDSATIYYRIGVLDGRLTELEKILKPPSP
jgi:hypothetical protein